MPEPAEHGHITSVEGFAKHVVETLRGGEPAHEDAPPAPAAEGVEDPSQGDFAASASTPDEMDWSILIEVVAQVIMQIIQNCPDNRSAISGAIKAPTLRQRAIARREVSRCCEECGHQTLPFRRQSGRIYDCIVKCAQHLSEEERMAVIGDAANPDFLVI